MGYGKRGEFQEIGRDSSKGSLLTLAPGGGGWNKVTSSGRTGEVPKNDQSECVGVCASCELRIRTGEDWFPLPKLYMIILTTGDRLLLPRMHFFFSPVSVRAIISPSG
jgi:hypothetical protein